MMAEEETEPGKEETETPPVVPDPQPVKEPPVVDLVKNANDAADRLKEQNDLMAANIKRMEALAVQKTLGGKADAGTSQEEETPADYAKKVMAGEDGK